MLDSERKDWGMKDVIEAILNLKKAIQASGSKSDLIKIEVTKDVEQRLIYHLMQSFVLNTFPSVDKENILTCYGVKIEVKNGN